MKVMLKRLSLVLTMMCFIALASPLTVFATSLDDLSSGSKTNSGSQDYSNDNSSEDSSFADYLQGFTPIDDENMAQADALTSPMTNVIGTFTGVILALTTACLFAITALDLAYIVIPPLRQLLNPGYNASLQMSTPTAGASSYGGMGMGMGGYGRGMGMGMGGVPMGGAQPQAQSPVEYGLKRKWVSDEAEFVVLNYQREKNLALQSMGGAGAMGTPGMGMGMPGMGMGMPGAAPMPQVPGQPQPPIKLRSVIFEYLKKRTVVIVIFAVCSVVLTSSVLLDCGLNLGAALNKLIGIFSNKVGAAL